MRLDAAIADATRRLSKFSESARLDVEILLSQTIDMPRSYLFSHPEDELDELSRERFERLLGRRMDGEPMAYITGTREFWSHELLVNAATLVPRPETELLVELALSRISQTAKLRIADLGTGSGAIAIAIGAERPLCDVYAVDISEDAIAVARQNIRHAELANVTCLVGNWIAPVVDQTFDLIVSNPPYIEDADPALRDLRYEPLSSLASGADGLDDIRVLAVDCIDILRIGGQLLIEHGTAQADGVADILKKAGWSEIQCHNDLSGRPRVTAARWNDT